MQWPLGNPWCIGGDFHVVTSSYKRCNSLIISWAMRRVFKFVVDFNWLDILTGLLVGVILVRLVG